MSGYTITITSDEDKSNTMTLHLDVTEGVVRMTDVHLHAAGGFPNGQIPAIDFPLLVEAVTGGAVKAAPPAEAEAAKASPPSRATKTAKATGPARPGRTVKGAKTTKKAGTKEISTAAKSAKAAPAAPAAEPAKAADSTAGRTRRGDRAYRRTPPDFVEVFQRVGGATAAAKHYGVPRHTANGWVRRLREQGVLSW